MFNLLSKNRTKLSSSFSLNFQFSLEYFSLDMIQNWRPHFERQRVGPWFLRRQCNVAKNCAGDVTWQRTSFGVFLYNPIIMILVLVSCWAYHIKVCAFHCFSLCANACLIDTCPLVLFLSLSALCLAAFPQLLAFPPLHLQRRKKLKMR